MPFKSFKKAVSDASKTINKTAEDTKKVVSNTGKTIEKTFEDTKKVVSKNISKTIGNAVDKSGYETNKFKLQKEIEQGSWIVAWGDDISETDVGSGVVAAGISIYTANPTAFLVWVENLVNKTISSLTKDAKKTFPDAIRKKINKAASDIILQAVKGKSTKEITETFDTVDFKAGAIRYSGSNKLAGNTISKTWGMKPYIALRWH